VLRIPAGHSHYNSSSPSWLVHFTRGLSRLEPGQALGSRAYRSSQVAFVPRCSDWSRLIRGEVGQRLAPSPRERHGSFRFLLAHGVVGGSACLRTAFGHCISKSRQQVQSVRLSSASSSLSVASWLAAGGWDFGGVTKMNEQPTSSAASGTGRTNRAICGDLMPKTIKRGHDKRSTE